MIPSTEIQMNLSPRSPRTVMLNPDGTRAFARRAAKVDNNMVKAIARAFRWQKLILDGKCNTLLDIAVKEKICPSFVSRVARLSTLSPRVIEAVLEGNHPTSLSMKDLFKPFPSD